MLRMMSSIASGQSTVGTVAVKVPTQLEALGMGTWVIDFGRIIQFDKVAGRIVSL